MPPKKTDVSTAEVEPVTETQGANDAEQASVVQVVIDPAVTDPVEPDSEPSTSEPIPDVAGRALIDLPTYGLKCGEYGALPAAIAASLEFSGEFDPRAVQP